MSRSDEMGEHEGSMLLSVVSLLVTASECGSLGILRGERGKRGERGDREEDRGAAERGEGWEGKGDLWARVSRERVSGH